MNTKNKQLFDVVIYEFATKKIESVIGKDMPLKSGSFHTAEKRLETALGRVNDNFGVMILKADYRWKPGATIRPEDIEESGQLQDLEDEE